MISLTLKDRKKIYQMIQAGVTQLDIAEIMGLTRHQLRREIEKCGSIKKYDPIKADEISKNPKQNDKRIFTEKEVSFIKEKIEEGYGVGKIASDLKCGNEVLRKFLHKQNIDTKNTSLKSISLRIDGIEETLKIILENVVK